MTLPLIQPLDPPPDVGETLRRFADWPNVVLFDSASRRAELGRYSFLAADHLSLKSYRLCRLGPIRSHDCVNGRGVSWK